MYLKFLSGTLLSAGVISLLLVLPVQAQNNALQTQVGLMLTEGHNAILNGQNKLAVDLLSKVVTTPNISRLTQAQAVLRRGVAYQRLGDMKAAIANFDYAYATGILPTVEMKDLLYSRAKAYLTMGNRQMALRDHAALKQLENRDIRRIQLDPLGVPTVTASINAPSYQNDLNKAHQAIVSGQNKQAIKILTKMIGAEKTPKTVLAKALFRRGVAQQRTGHIAASIADFTNAEELKVLSKSEKRDLLFNRARSYQAVGMLKLAEQDRVRLQKIDGIVVPDNEDIDLAPTQTASLGAQKIRRKGKKKRYVRTYVATAKPKNLVEHLSVLLGKKP